MKSLLAIILFFYFPVQLRAQVQVDSMSPGYNPFLADSLRSRIDRADNDTTKAWNMILLYWAIEGVQSDSAMAIAKQAYEFSKSKQLKFMEVYALMAIGYNQKNTGDYAESLKTYLQAFEILGYSSFHESNSLPDADGSVLDRDILHEYAETQRHMGFLLGRVGNRTEELNKYRTALKIHEALKDERLVANTTNNIAEVYLATNLPDSAILFAEKSLGHYEKQNVPFYVKTYLGHIYNIIGESNLLMKKYDLAEDALLKAEKANIKYKNLRILIQTYLLRAEIFNQKQEFDSSLNYAHKARLTAEEVGLKSFIAQTYSVLANAYRTLNKQDSGYYYLKQAAPLVDSLNKIEKNNLIRYQNILFTENQNLQKIEQEKTANQNRIRIISLLGTLGFILLVALLLYRNNRQKQKSNRVLETTLTNLKSAQSQLIQSEKMASLGELTAGIAHEIQNPLNFVNNFSEVNKELAVELEEEIDKGNYSDAKAIAKDIRDNEEKINHHGNRAAAIVKGMLQHSSSSSGVKEPTNINALADEYLRLAYHGLRAKDKSFNATMKTDFDESIRDINIIPQDIGRVILNLITNAFYVIDEKKKQQLAGYEPTVEVSTRKESNKVLISVKDNGNGIPQKILDKIFQPFFTTKPTGQGTGLGLSLSYDIVKAHGGELKVETKEGEGSEFIIQLPN
ncbi:MAG: ATP-binding protein [Chitinophagaceae bacterium]